MQSIQEEQSANDCDKYTICILVKKPGKIPFRNMENMPIKMHLRMSKNMVLKCIIF